MINMGPWRCAAAKGHGTFQPDRQAETHRRTGTDSAGNGPTRTTHEPV